MVLMRPRIAIAVPHSEKSDYSARALPQYTSAVQDAGGTPVVIPLDRQPDEIARLLSQCDAALLPGSPADVDPQKYDAARDPHTAAADSRRDMVDELLLQDAYNLRKPILGICYGLQSLNVWRTGTLVQHIESAIKHTAGREVLHAHNIAVEPVSKLATIFASRGSASGLAPTADLKPMNVEVNSSHHQSADVVGDGLRVVARCPDDGVVEALEGTSPDHWVLAVQWHPERMTESDESARAIFRAFVSAARK